MLEFTFMRKTTLRLNGVEQEIGDIRSQVLISLVLATIEGRGISADELIDDIWGESTLNSVTELRQTIGLLRQQGLTVKYLDLRYHLDLGQVTTDIDSLRHYAAAIEFSDLGSWVKCYSEWMEFGLKVCSDLPYSWLSQYRIHFAVKSAQILMQIAILSVDARIPNRQRLLQASLKYRDSMEARAALYALTAKK